MATKDKRASYSVVNINGKEYIRIKRRCGFKNDIPYYKDFHGKTKKEAEAKYKAYRIEHCLDENGLPDLNAKRIERRTFRELFNDWLDNVFMLDSNYAAGTKQRYISAYNANMKWRPIMDEYIATLIGSDLQKCLNSMDCGASSVLACLKLMRLFFKYQEAQGVCTDISRAVKVTQEVAHKRQDQTIQTITSEEIAKILDGFAQHRLYLLILLAVHTGARISELLALQYSDITDEGIRFNKQVSDNGSIAKTKTVTSNRVVYISDNIREAIKEHKAEHTREMLSNGYRTDYIFTTRTGNLYNKHNVRHAVDRVYNKIGVEPIGFHVYRHTYASMLANNGIPIQTLAALLGHTDSNTTARYYVNVSKEQKQAAANLIHEVLQRA